MPRPWTLIGATLALLLALGCEDGETSDAVPDGGLDPSTDGDALSDFCLDNLPCTDVPGVLNFISLNDYVLVAAQAQVEADNKRFEFRLKWLGEGQGALGGCTYATDLASVSFSADFAEEITRANGNSFSIFTTTPFRASQGGILGRGELQLGLFEFGTSQDDRFPGTEYSLVPTGTSALWCRREDSLLRCDLGWFGVLTKSPIDPDSVPGSEKSTGVVNVTCLFARRDGAFAGCLEDCFDDNPCTYDYCDENNRCTNTPVELLPLSDVVSFPQDPLIPEVVGEFAHRCTTDQGELGLCIDGVCADSPCEDDCKDQWTYDQDADRCTGEVCGTHLPNPTCITTEIDDCSTRAPAN